MSNHEDEISEAEMHNDELVRRHAYMLGYLRIAYPNAYYEALSEWVDHCKGTLPDIREPIRYSRTAHGHGRIGEPK